MPFPDTQNYQIKSSVLVGWWRMPSIPALGRQRQTDICEFEASMVFRASSRTGSKATKKPVSKKKKSSVLGMGSLLWSYWSLGFHRLPSKLQATAIFLGYPPELDVKTLLLKIPIHESQIWRNPTGTYQKASSLLASFSSAGRCYAHYWRRKVTINFI